MAKNGKVLIAIALIFGIIGSGASVYLIINEFAIQEPLYVVPMARIYAQHTLDYNLSNNVFEAFDYTHASYDTHDAFDFNLDRFIIPESGCYAIYAQFCIDGTGNETLGIKIIINGIMHAFQRSGSGDNYLVSVYDVANVSVGDYVSINGTQANLEGQSREVWDFEQYTFFTIAKLS